MTSNTLITFIGTNDGYLVTPDPRSGKVKSGAIISIVESSNDVLGFEFDKLIMVYDGDHYEKIGYEIKNYLKNHFTSLIVELKRISIADPISHHLVYPAMYKAVKEIKSKNKDSNFYISVTSGTPTMHACWIFLVKGGVINAELLQTSDKSGLNKINFEIDDFPQITKLPEIKTELTILKRENDFLRHRKLNIDIPEMIGSSEVIKNIKKQIELLANFNVPIMILGESGTGKEVVARALHDHSSRKSNHFSAVNCGAIPENLMESQFFGFVKGAFTGANQDTPGIFEKAKGGTLFLDEIGDLPLFMQVKLLRVLQEKKISRVGEMSKEIDVDVRIIAVTNKDLWSMMNEGKFREDLFFRLTDDIITLPSLRDRGNDIIEIAEKTLSDLNNNYNKKLKFSKSAIDKLVNYSWKGNVRELTQVIRRAFIYCGDIIEAEDIRFLIRSDKFNNNDELTLDGIDLKEKLQEIEVSYIKL